LKTKFERSGDAGQPTMGSAMMRPKRAIGRLIGVFA
jgi:hypothetical protein